MTIGQRPATPITVRACPTGTAGRLVDREFVLDLELV